MQIEVVYLALGCFRDFLGRSLVNSDLLQCRGWQLCLVQLGDLDDLSTGALRR